MKSTVSFILFWALQFAVPSAASADLRLGATHTLEDSGILKVLVPAFEAAERMRVLTLVAGTGQVMKYAENGDVDVIFTHSRSDEEKLVANGIGIRRFDVMYNDFVLAGPPADPAAIRGMPDAAQAFKRIRGVGARFVSRGDDSGTHKKELALWGFSGGLAKWPGYVSAGQGAGKTVMMADELGAYLLIDRATLRALHHKHSLVALSQGDPRLLNEYGVTAISTKAHPAANSELAGRFVAWLTSDAARKLIAGYRIDGEQAFFVRKDNDKAVERPAVAK